MSVNLIPSESTNCKTGDSVVPSPPRMACVNSTTFLIGRNGKGQWIARERNGLYGGLFVSQANAVRYALFENGHRPEAIIMVSGIIELDMSAVPSPDLPVTPAAVIGDDRLAA